MSEIKTPLDRSKNFSDDWEYIIREHHTARDILRHVILEIGDEILFHVKDLLNEQR